MIEPDKKPVFVYDRGQGYYVGTISTRDRVGRGLMFWDIYITHDHASWFRVVWHGISIISPISDGAWSYAAWYEADLRTLFAADKERCNDPSISPNAR